jgi:hypothetical protein
LAHEHRTLEPWISLHPGLSIWSRHSPNKRRPQGRVEAIALRRAHILNKVD